MPRWLSEMRGTAYTAQMSRYWPVALCVMFTLPGMASVPVNHVAATVAGILLAQDEQYREREILDPNSDQWLLLPPPDPNTPEGALAIARERLARGEVPEARRLLEEWVSQNADSERLPEAEFLLGEACYEMRDYWRANEHYEIVAENASGELFYRALGRQMDVALAFFAGEKRVVFGFLPISAVDDGFSILDKIWERAAGTRLGEEALKKKADERYARGELDLAQAEYANLVREYPSGRYAQPASLRAAESAAGSYEGSKFDDRPLVQAQERYRQVQSAYPVFAESEAVAERLEGIRQQRADKDLEVARWYEKTGRDDAAAYYYRLILKDYPGTLAEGQARQRLRALGAEVPEPSSESGE